MIRFQTAVFPLLCTLCVLLVHPAGAQNLNTLSNTYKRLDPDLVGQLTDDPACKITTQDFWTVLQALQAENVFQTQLRGSSSFSFNSDEAGDNTRYRFGAGASLSRGNYPSQIQFSTNIGVTLRGSTFEEEVSELSISYDHHQSLGFENYFFAERYTDNFLGIDQRYEVGGGVIFQHYSGYTASGQGPKATMNAFDMNAAYDLAGQIDAMAADEAPVDSMLAEIDEATRDWYQCLGRAQSADTTSLTDAALIDLIRKTKADLKALAKFQHEAQQATQKRYGRLRVGLLLGIFGELEKATVGDTLVVDDQDTKQFFSQSLPGQQAFRWEIRPTFTFRPSDRLRFDLRPYFKFPMPWDWQEDVARTDPDGIDQRANVRVDWINTLTVRIGSSFLQKGSVSARLTYRLLYDHAPPRTLLPLLDPETGEPLLLTAEDTHHILKLSFSVAW